MAQFRPCQPDFSRFVSCFLQGKKPAVSATKPLIHRGRETLKEKLKPYLQTGKWTE
jgi:hypothetical protein